MNNNYVLLGLSVLAVASIYLFWLNYKQTQETRNLYMRFGNVGGMSPEIQEDLSTKFNKFDGDLDKLKQYVFGELLPRLEKQHHITQQKLQELQYHTGLVELPTEIDNSPSENLSGGEESINHGDDECSVNGSDRCLDDLDMEGLDINDLDLGDMDDLHKAIEDNSYHSDNSDNSDNLDDIDMEDLDDMKSIVFSVSKKNDTLVEDTPVAVTLVEDTQVADTLVADTLVANTLVANTQQVELDGKTLLELKTMARDLGIKPKGNKNDLIKTLLGKN